MILRQTNWKLLLTWADIEKFGYRVEKVAVKKVAVRAQKTTACLMF